MKIADLYLIRPLENLLQEAFANALTLELLVRHHVAHDCILVCVAVGQVDGQELLGVLENQGACSLVQTLLIFVVVISSPYLPVEAILGVEHLGEEHVDNDFHLVERE